MKATIRGKDLKEGMVLGTRRVHEILHRKGQWVYYSYDYLVVDDDGATRWYRQNPPPVGRIAVNKVIEDDLS